MPTQLFSIEEAAHRCGVSRATFCRMIAADEIRSVKVGRRRLVSDTAISEFIERLEIQALRGAA